uniref:Uncharacterized protein n=1 Tax=Caenorhabditis brenneri TaxID=135651 RepID=B6VBS2_CAEBE|nr:hypothetical protein Cbre_JD22.003 [Caenorhabditis brenneri]
MDREILWKVCKLALIFPTISIITSSLTMIIVSFLVFPLYVTVYRSMREKEKQSMLTTTFLRVILDLEEYEIFDSKMYTDGNQPTSHILIIEVMSTPALIQLSYLLCNRANVRKLRKQLSFRMLFGKMIDWILRKDRGRSVQVSPDLNVDDMRTTVV